ncbi:MAG TPA: ABC transporter substrate-binding protein [Chloroflexota bacterium]|nr:ABC transporter substrate-binding protein [Chloroflexota bacterium]
MRRASALLTLWTLVSLLLVACRPDAGAAPAPAVPPAGAAEPAAAAPAAAPAPASQPPAQPVAVQGGLLPSILSAPIFAGVDMGIYQQNGLDVTVEPFTVTSDIMTLVGSGRLQFGQATMGSAAFNAFNRGVDLVITAGGPLGILHLLIRKDLWDSGAIRSTRDLKGTRFALNGRGVIIEYVQYKILERGGLTPDDVEVPILPWPDQIPALGNHAIDVGLVGDPLGALAVSRGVATILEERDPSGREPWYAPGLQGSVLMMNRPWAEANPAAASAVVKSYLQTARRIQGTKIFDDTEALASVEKWVDVKPEVVKAGAPPIWTLNGRVDADILADVQRYFIESGGTDYHDPLPLDRLYDDRYLNAALAEIGTVPEN